MTQESTTAVATAPQGTRALERPARPEVAPLAPEHPVTMTVVRSVPGLPPDRAEVERIEHVVTLPAAYQFPMGTRKVKQTKRGNQWVDATDPITNELLIEDTRKVGITSDGYLFLNKTLGYDLVLTETVTDREGRERRNPIHGPEYLAIRGGIIYRSDFGQLMWAEETIEADFWHVYQDARLNQWSAHVRKGQDGRVQLDEAGFPIFDLSDDDEVKAARVFSALKASGLKRSQTTLFTRLLKVAVGIKSLPIPVPQSIDVRLVTFRDSLSPEERTERAMATQGIVYGGSGMQRRVKGMTPAEVEAMADRGDDDAAMLGADEADRAERSRGDRIAGAYSPEAEARAGGEGFDPSTVPGVQRGVKDVTPPDRREPTPEELDAADEAARAEYESAQGGQRQVFDAADLRDVGIEPLDDPASR